MRSSFSLNARNLMQWSYEVVSYSNKTVCTCQVECGKHNKDFYQNTRSLRKEGFYSPTNTLLSDLPLKLKFLFFSIFFFSRGAFEVNNLYHKIVWKFAVWRCVDDLAKHIYRFHVRYLHSSFYLIRSIFNVYFVTSQNHVCFRMSLWCSSTGCT